MNPQAKALLARLENTAVVQLRRDAVMNDGVVLPQTHYFNMARDGGIDLVDLENATMMPFLIRQVFGE